MVTRPDTYKLPNHITFSDESVQLRVERAIGNKQMAAGSSHTRGPTNLKFQSMDQMRDYFRRVEPESTLIDPQQDAPLPQKFAQAGQVQLTPVEHDPFLPYAGYKPSSFTLHPVEHDPFN